MLVTPLLLNSSGRDLFEAIISINILFLISKSLSAGYGVYFSSESYKRNVFNDSSTFIASNTVNFILIACLEMIIFTIISVLYLKLSLSLWLLLYVITGNLILGLLNFLAKLLLTEDRYNPTIWFSIFSILLNIIIIYFYSILGNHSLITYLQVIIVNNLIFSISLYFFIRHKTSYFLFLKKPYVSTCLKDLRKSKEVILYSVLNQINQNGFFLILRTLFPFYLTEYITLRTLSNSGLQSQSVIINPYLPRLLNLQRKLGYERCVNLVMRINLDQYFTFIILALILGNPMIPIVYETWIGNSIIFNPLMFYSISISSLFLIIINGISTILSGLNFKKVLLHFNIAKIIIYLILGIILKISMIYNDIWIIVIEGLLPLIILNIMLKKISISLENIKKYMVLTTYYILFCLGQELAFSNYWFNALAGGLVILFLSITKINSIENTTKKDCL